MGAEEPGAPSPVLSPQACQAAGKLCCGGKPVFISLFSLNSMDSTLWQNLETSLSLVLFSRLHPGPRAVFLQ